MWNRTLLASFELFTGSRVEHLKKTTNNLGPGRRRSVGPHLVPTRTVTNRQCCPPHRDANVQLSNEQAASIRRRAHQRQTDRQPSACSVHNWSRKERRVSRHETNGLQQKWGQIILLKFSRLRTSFSYQRKEGSRRVPGGSFLPCYYNTPTLSSTYTLYYSNRHSVGGNIAGQLSAEEFPGKASSNCQGSGSNYVAYVFVFVCTFNICRLYKSTLSHKLKPLCN